MGGIERGGGANREDGGGGRIGKVVVGRGRGIWNGGTQLDSSMLKEGKGWG